MEAKVSYFWQKDISPAFSIFYESNVDRGNEGEWILYAHSWPVWNIASDTKIMFKTKETLMEFTEKAYEEYLANQDKRYFECMFGKRSVWGAALKFIRMYLNMKYGED